jgi:hypothetical protein
MDRKTNFVHAALTPPPLNLAKKLRPPPPTRIFNCVHLCYRNGGKDEWEFLWKKFQEERVDSERTRIIAALGATQDPDLIIRYLEETFGSALRHQDLIYVYKSVSNRTLAFLWLESNWEKIGETLEGSFGYVIGIVTGYGGSAKDETPIRDLFERRGHELIDKAWDFKNAIENAKINAMWVKEQGPVVSQWLKKQK